MPNAAGIPTSTLQTNIYYHLGLAYYLQGAYAKAHDSYRTCLELAKNNDMRVATLDWLYMTLRRLGRHEEAAKLVAGIDPAMEILENHAYHRRLLMYAGKLEPEALLRVADDDDTALTLATQGYGVGNFYLMEGERDKAIAVFEQVIAGDYWAAFGHIAAEADLVRLEKAP